MTPRWVLFDLDGTLSDSARGILAALRHAFAVNGIAPLDEQAERAILGPPFYESLPPIVGGPAEVAAVIASYREHYGNGGMFDTQVFPGVHDLLLVLQDEGLQMAVATSKPEHYAVPIVEHLGLSDFFVTVGGDELDGSLGTKALVIGKVLDRLGNPDAGAVVMVGDRSHDVLGARAHGVDCIGVEWGYALPGELLAAQAWAICATPDELPATLGLDVDAAAS